MLKPEVQTVLKLLRIKQGEERPRDRDDVYALLGVELDKKWLSELASEFSVIDILDKFSGRRHGLEEAEYE